jgi:ABC-type Fe3+-hydroxamate transport system substrate-binding protein
MRAALIATALALVVAACGEEQGSEPGPQTNDSFPVSIEHKFGTTTVEQPPERVVTVGVNDQDFALALGVTPVGVRQFQGGIEHPEFEGSSFVLASASGGQIYVYGPQDLRSRFFTSLGFETPKQIEELAGDSFYAQLSEEQLRLLDQDVVVVYGTEKDFAGFPLFQRLDAVREGRAIYMDVEGDFANALGFSSPLSIPFALEQAVPQLAAAVKEAE